MSKALFPISIDSDLFRSDAVLLALLPLAKRHEEVVFFIADRLKMYNDVAESGKNFTDVLLDWQQQPDKYKLERSAWLNKLRLRINPHGLEQKWTIIGIDDIMNNRCYRILRNINAMFSASESLRHDVEEVASLFVKSRHFVPFPDIAYRVSIYYILEEIAINLRIRVVDDIRSEYYMGHYPAPLLNLYRGKYGVDVHILSEVDKVSNRNIGEFEFYIWNFDKNYWSLLD